MRHIDGSAIVYTPAASAATDASTSQSFSTLGYDQANIFIQPGTMSAGSETLRTIAISESDTATTPASMTDIVALAVGTATSTSVPTAMPAIAKILGGAVLAFQIDLRARKLYMGVEVTPGVTTNALSILTLLSRAEESADTAAEKCVTNNNLTTSTSCALVVTA